MSALDGPSPYEPNEISTARPISIEFDDIIYMLQRFGGISEYWSEITSRIAAMPSFDVRRRSGTTWGRMQTKRTNSTLFHSSYFRTARGLGVRNITTVHDLAYEFGHTGSGIAASLHRLEHRRAYFASDGLICVSKRTHDDLLDFYPALAGRCRLYVIPHGVSMKATEIASASSAHLSIANRPYVLFVGGRLAYKNFGTALAAFAASTLPRDGALLVCTGTPFTKAELKEIKGLGLSHSVRMVGRVSRAALADLYLHAHCLLYPSLFEGFGLPLIEAMRLGCPVIASNTSVMPEVCGDAALLVDGRDPQGFAKSMQELLDPTSRKLLIERGRQRAARYTWEASARSHALAYAEIAR